MSTLDDFIQEEDALPDQLSLYDPELETQCDSGMRALNNERRLIETSTELTDEEKEGLTEFDKAMRDQSNKKNDRRPGTRALYLKMARLAQKSSGLLLKSSRPGEEGSEALNELLEHMTSKEHKTNYTHNFMIAIQAYGKLCAHESNVGEFEEMTPGRYRRENKPPKSSNVLSWKDAVKMAETEDNMRNKAMILLGWGSGGRPKSELWDLTYGDITWLGDHYEVNIPWTGKTGRRLISVHPGAPTLQEWMENEHPVHSDPDETLNEDTLLWTKFNKNEQLSYSMMGKIFKKAGEAADIDKDHNPRHLRRSRFSFLAGKPTVSEDDLRYYGGWDYDSPAPKAYIAEHTRDNERNISMADGVSDIAVDDVVSVAPIECNHCNQMTERHMENCIRCGAKVDEDLHGEAFNLNDPVKAGRDSLDVIQEEGLLLSDIEALERLRPLIRTQGENIWQNIDLLKTIAKAEGGEEETCVTGPGSYFAQISGAATTAAGSAAEAWVRAKHTAMSLHPDFEYYPQMPMKRFVTMVTILAAATLAFLGSMYIDGSLHALAAGDPVEWAALLTAAVFAKWLFDREFPTVDEARRAAKQEDEE